MAAEPLIALEAALAELSTLYTVASAFTPLQGEAETELLPQLSRLGGRLRQLLRTARLTGEEVDTAAREIMVIRASWRGKLDRLRQSPRYQQALKAFAADHQAELEELIPALFAGLQPVRSVPTLYFPVSPSSGKRRPGASPFLSADDCADRIVRMLGAGIEPEEGGAEWWERELPPIMGADDPSALETPVGLRLTRADVRVAVFAAADDPNLRIFTPRLRAPMSIVLAADATDEWWLAYQDSYRSFRDALERALQARHQTVTIVES